MIVFSRIHHPFLHYHSFLHYHDCHDFRIWKVCCCYQHLSQHSNYPNPHDLFHEVEVRAHDVPFLVEDGQAFFRLKFFRASSRPKRLYGEAREGASYQGQDLTLARAFRRTPPA